MKISKNLFTLTKEQEETSKMIYNGKIIKCLIAPYHSYNDLEKVIPYSKTTYLFPEREVAITQLSQLISIIVATPSNDEFCIVTTNMNIILDMVDACVRVLTEDGDIVDCPCKTFMANIHTIRYKILENDDFKSSKPKANRATGQIQELIDTISGSNGFTAAEKIVLYKRIDMIGEQIIRGKLHEMLDDVKTI